MFYRALALFAVLSLCAPAFAQTGGDVWLFIFAEDGSPVAGVDMQVDGDTVDTSSPAGAIYARIAAGRRDVSLVRDGETLLELDLLTADEEDIQILVTLRSGREPDVAIESSGTDPVLTGQTEEQRIVGAFKPGLLEGEVVSVEDGAPIVGAEIFVAGTQTRMRTNEAGQYQAELPPGNYTLSIVHPDYAAQTLENIRVIPGKAVTASVEMAPSGVQLAEYTVTAPFIEGSVASTFTLQRESSQVTEVLGAEQIARTGDSDAAEALTRVSGLTLEQGKFVVIRGQPSRYTYAQFNGSPLPSTDPVRQSVPLDLFPAGVLSGIEVQKSYSADQPGAFGAGLVSLNTRKVPQSGFVDLSVSTGANSASTGETGATYDGSVEDFLGQDNGARALPGPIRAAGGNLQSVANEQERIALGKSFNDVHLPETMELPADVGGSLSGGKGFDTSYGRFGVLASASYDHKYRFIEERDITYEGNSVDTLRVQQDFTDRRTERDIRMSALAVFSGEWENHSLSLNNFFIRDTKDRTSIADGISVVSDEFRERQFLLEFNQRETLLHQLVGSHDFDFVQVDWRAQTADGDRDRPDRRTWNYQGPLFNDDPLEFAAEDALQREFNVVTDEVNSYGLDLTFPLNDWGRLTPMIKVGLADSAQERVSVTRRFNFEPAGSLADLSQPIPELIINDFTIGDTVNFSERTVGSDRYFGTADVSGFYALTDLRWADLLRLTLGVRREEADYEVTTPRSVTDDAGTVSGFDRTDTLPSLGLTWFSSENTQVRFTTGKSVSYPLLVEISDTLFLDPDTGEQFAGNPDLEATEIESYDLRWEWYPSAKEAVTAGVFLKDLKNPIERQFLPVAGGGQRIQFTNGETGEVYGFEIDGRAGLDWFSDIGLLPESDLLKKSYVQANFTITESEVEIGPGGIATNRQRRLQGQADTVFNFQLGYDGAIHDWTLALNRVGERLDAAGANGRPDVFQQPSTFVDLTYSLGFFKRGNLKLKAENLLNEEIEFMQGPLLQQRFILGRSFGASLSWEVF